MCTLWDVSGRDEDDPELAQRVEQMQDEIRARREGEVWATVARRISELREQRHWTMQDLAHEMWWESFRWTTPTVSKIESQKRWVSLPELCVLAEIFGVDPSDMPPPPGRRSRRAGVRAGTAPGGNG